MEDEIGKVGEYRWKTMGRLEYDNVLNLWFKIGLTGNIYIYCWFMKNSKGLNDLSSSRKLQKGEIKPLLYLSILHIISMIAIIVTALVSKNIRLTILLFAPFISFLILLWAAIYMRLVFISRKMIEEHCKEKRIDIRVDPTFTLLFQLFYLQRVINELIRKGVR